MVNLSTQVTEATYRAGVLHPAEPFELRENQRVRIIVFDLDEAAAVSREEAMQRLRAGIASMNFHSTGPYPERHELYEHE